MKAPNKSTPRVLVLASAACLLCPSASAGDERLAPSNDHCFGATLLLRFGQSVGGCSLLDADHNGVINTADLTALLLRFGRSCAAAAVVEPTPPAPIAPADPASHAAPETPTRPSAAGQ